MANKCASGRLGNTPMKALMPLACALVLCGAIVTFPVKNRALAQDAAAEVCDALHAIPRLQALPVVPYSASGSDAYDFSPELDGPLRFADSAVTPTDAEREDLETRARSHDFSFAPNCDWMMAPRLLADYPYLAFANPLSSSDGKLLLVRYTLITNSGPLQGGETCAIRKLGDSWKASCIPWSA